MGDPQRIRIDEAGHLVLEGHDGWREPICSACGNPIPWVLDMMSFVRDDGRGCFVAQHAACAWTAEAFTDQRKRARAKHYERVVTDTPTAG